MGYSYSYSNRLCCDGCGVDRGVRKRKCPHKVVDYREDGQAYAPMSYCPAPAYCSSCYKDRGGLRGVHGDSCKEGAAAMQAQEDAKRDAIAAGEMFVKAAWGQWHDSVPMDKVGLLYAGKEGEVYILVPAERYKFGVAYKFGSRPVLSELADVMEEWPGHPHSGSGLPEVKDMVTEELEFRAS